MKKIFFVRHAKSDWSVSGIDDIDRPLNQRGYADAHRTGKFLKNILPEYVTFVSSPAVRAISTALIFARETEFPTENIFIQPALYESDESDYEKSIHVIDDLFDTVLIFGHNPTISDVIRKLSKNNLQDVPTCSVSIILFDTDSWKRTFKTAGTLENQIFPKSLTI